MWRKALAVGLITWAAVSQCTAQGYVDQQAVAPLLDGQGSSADVKPVGWHIYKVSSAQKTNKAVEKKLQAHLDSLPGTLESKHRMHVVELTNRVRAKYLLQRSELLIPDAFVEDFRAYAPYPIRYHSAAPLPKLFVVDKYTQTFAAYEGGTLVRWGLVSTGADDANTPAGRYTFNWKQEYRESTAAPEGEVWKMRWVWNFHGPRGIHVHQYAVPIAQPASHGCVRLTEADAAWNFLWAEKGTPVIVINNSPAGLATHWLMAGRRPISSVDLPDNPMDVPPGVKGSDDVAAR